MSEQQFPPFNIPVSDNVQAGTVPVNNQQTTPPNGSSVPSFLQQSNTNTFNNQTHSTSSTTKYRILDLGWFINHKLELGQQLEQNEAQIALISFNMDFGNLRIRFSNIPQQAVKGNVVFAANLDLLVVGVIYPTYMYRYKNIDKGDFTCIEQLISNTGEAWQSSRPIVQVSKNDDFTTIFITDNEKGQFQFTFMDWQKKAFDDIINWCLTNGASLTAQVINNR